MARWWTHVTIAGLASVWVLAACGSDTPTTPSSATQAAAVEPASSPNTPLVIESITVRGYKPREPAGFADVGETVGVSAIVRAESAVSRLRFQWSATAGTFSGTGPDVRWTAPAEYATPATVTLKLRVVEPDVEIATGGRDSSRRAREVTKSVDLRLHDSVAEVSALALDFMDTFSKQLDPEYVTRNFSPRCTEAAEERFDTLCQQREVRVLSYTLGTPQTTVPFAGHCPFGDRAPTGDACSPVPADWHVVLDRIYCHPNLRPELGSESIVTGVDMVTAVFEDDQWRLCASNWDQKSSVRVR